MLHASHISVCKGGQRCLKDVSFSLVGGDLTALLGASGSGKTTLLEVCAGLIAPGAGDVWVAGRKLCFWRAAAPGVRIAYLSSEEPWRMSVAAGDVVAMGCQDPTVPDTERRRRTRLALASVQAEQWLTRTMPLLSPTQQVRVRLARLLVQMWDVQHDGLSYVLMDAPHGATCQRTQALVVQVARGLAQRGAAVGLVTHDYTRVLNTAHRVVMLREGEVVADGSPSATLTPARLAIVLKVDAAIELSEKTGQYVVTPRDDPSAINFPF